MRLLMLFSIGLIGCSVPPDFAVPPHSEVPAGEEVKIPEARKKALSGSVIFDGVDSATLAGIRVIPESGRTVFEPRNGRYDQVDGFWWRGDRDRWFKIPDHGEARVGTKPASFDGVAELGGVRIYYKSQSLLGLANAMRGGVKEPGWVPDGGTTKSPVGYPWID